MSEAIIQGSPEWFALRAGRATGSNFDAVLAQGKGSAEATTRAQYRVRLAIERITGKVMESGYKNSAMQHGTDTEPLARMAYEEKTGNIVEEVAFVQHEYLMAGVSPDGLIGSNGMIEIKCPTPAVHWEYLQLTDKPPAAYKAQVYGQLWVAKREWCDFVSYSPDFPEPLQLHIFRVYRDEKYIKTLADGVAKFLYDVEKTVKEMRELAEQRAA